MGTEILNAVQAVGTWVGNGLVSSAQGIGAVCSTIADGTIKFIQTVFFLG